MTAQVNKGAGEVGGADFGSLDMPTAIALDLETTTVLGGEEVAVPLTSASGNQRTCGVKPSAPFAGMPYQEPVFDNELEPFTDVGNAARLALNCGAWLRYVPAWGWLVYRAGTWRRDNGQQMVMEGAKEVLRRMAADHLGNGTKAEQDAWHRHIRYSFNHVDKLVQSARTVEGLAATIDAFDINPWLLNTQNVVLNLGSGQTLPHAPEHLLAKQANALYDPEATAPTWQRFLDDIFCGDAALVRWVQKALGYSLTGDTREQCFFICYGSGHNGKSTLLETLRAVAGDYAKPLKADALMDSPYRNGSGADPELAALVGARLVTAQEPHERGKGKAPILDTGRIKALTGGDALQVRELYGMPFTFVPRFKLWLAVNNRPEVPESTVGIWRRIRLIPFEASFPEGKADKELPDKLRAEASGILNWLLAGVALWVKEGLGVPPDAIREATNDYHDHEDEYAPFFSEVLVPVEGATVRLEEAWQAFLKWKQEMPYRAEWVRDSRQLGRLAEAHGLTRRRITSGAHKGKSALIGCCIAEDYAVDTKDEEDTEDAEDAA
jgi:putative DNA primase/helicase